MSRNETLNFLDSLQRFGWRLSLDRMAGLLKHLGNPQQQFRSVLVAGTNGKGSTCAMLEAILRHAGYQTGLFTSPHLVDVCERIQIVRRPISEKSFLHYIDENREVLEGLQCTYFEALAGIAFQYFADSRVDIAIVEVGLGGRFDATNLLQPELAVITEIDLDHVEHLGPDLASIAREKAGIVKPGAICLIQSEKPEVVRVMQDVSNAVSAELIRLEQIARYQNVQLQESFSRFDLRVSDQAFPGLEVALPGRTQISNCALAVAAAYLLRSRGIHVPQEAYYQGLRKVKWPGRLQRVASNPLVVVDVAHNAAAFNQLAEEIPSLFRFQKAIVICGLLRDKDMKQIAASIAMFADIVYLVRPRTERALPPALLAEEVSHKVEVVRVFESVEQAFVEARRQAEADDLICVTGSHYVVGEFMQIRREIIKKRT